jgi:hypothetical protein
MSPRDADCVLQTNKQTTGRAGNSRRLRRRHDVPYTVP